MRWNVYINKIYSHAIQPLTSRRDHKHTQERKREREKEGNVKKTPYLTTWKGQTVL